MTKPDFHRSRELKEAIEAALNAAKGDEWRMRFVALSSVTTAQLISSHTFNTGIGYTGTTSKGVELIDQAIESFTAMGGNNGQTQAR